MWPANFDLQRARDLFLLFILTIVVIIECVLKRGASSKSGGARHGPISHLYDTKQAIAPEKFSRILDTKHAKKLTYQRRDAEVKHALHWGQLKLLLTEIEFLTLVMEEYGANEKPIYMVYAGAAPGHHIGYLSKLFPKIHFELYDLTKFKTECNDKIKTHIQYFTDKDAEYWGNQNKDSYVVFCSDIRTEPATDEAVQENMRDQLRWWNLMKPELSMFKFRLPWKKGTTDYLEGKIYIQPFPGPTSTETRLIVKRDARMIQYDNIQYEEQLYYHNSVVRKQYFETTLGKLDLKKDGLDNCYDCTSFIEIIEQYLTNVVNKANASKPNKIDAKSIREKINEAQTNINFGEDNVYSRTIKYFDKLDKFQASRA